MRFSKIKSFFSPFFIYWGLIFTLGTVLRFWDLNRQSLWQDEIHTAIYVNDHPSLWQVIYRVATWDLHSPVYYVLLRIQVWFQQMFSIPLTDGNLRVSSALLGSGALITVFFMLSRLYNHKLIPLAGLFLAAINMYGIYFSQELRMYSTLMFLAPLLIYFRLRLWDTAEGKLNLGIGVGYLICSLLILYTTLVGLFFVAGIWLSTFVLCLFENRKHPRRWLEVLGLGGIIFLCYTPWLGVMWRQSKTLNQGVGTGLVITHPRELFKFAFELLTFYAWKLTPVYEVMNKIIRLLIPFALLNLLDSQKRKEHGMILLGFAFSFVLYYFVVYNRDFQTARYFAPWWPFAIYFLVAGFSGILVALEKIKPAWRWVGIALFFVFIVGYVFVQGKQIHYYFTDYQKENWREAVRYLEAHKQPGDGLVVTGQWEKTNLAYYGTTLPFVIMSDLPKAQLPEKYKRLIYLGADNPEKITQNLPIKFIEKPWPVKCKPYFVWEKK